MGKLYVSPASTEYKIRDLYEEVEAAVDSKILTDATSRNALYKIHVALGKIVNALGEQAETGRRMSRSTSASVIGGERTVLEDRTAVRAEPGIKEEEEEEGEESEGTVVLGEDKTQVAEKTQADSLVEDLLSDEEEL